MMKIVLTNPRNSEFEMDKWEVEEKSAHNNNGSIDELHFRGFQEGGYRQIHSHEENKDGNDDGDLEFNNKNKDRYEYGNRE
jgi:hypothetical protein